MHYIFLLLFLSFVGCNDNKITFPTRTAKVGQFPYVVLIRRDISQLHGDRNWCGGTLYSAIHVLTAAVCVADREKMIQGRLVYWAYGNSQTLEQLTVYAGTINADGSGGEKRKIKKLIIPAVMKFKADILQQNVVFLVLKQGFPLNEKIMTAPLSFLDQFGDLDTPYRPYMQNGSHCIMPGWGNKNVTKHKGENKHSFSPSKTLHIAEIKPIKTEECKKILCERKEKYCTQFGFSYDKIFCAVPNVENVSPCDYDEGSPLICDGSVIGLLAFVDHEIGCAPNAVSGFLSGHYMTEFVQDAFKGSGNALKAISYMITTLVAMLTLQ